MRITKNVKQNQTDTLCQSEIGMDWVLRHCSPNTIVSNSSISDWHRDQSDLASISSWCAPVDWSSVRLKDDN